VAPLQVPSPWLPPLPLCRLPPPLEPASLVQPSIPDRAASFGLLEDGDVLAVGKAGRLYVEIYVLK